MSTYMFTKLLPKEASFVRGESPSPDKLNGILNQMSSAMFILESFLGNGVDYRTTSNTERKLLFNVSSAIGKTDKLYKPANKLPNLERIDRQYSGSYGTYNSTDKTLSITDEIILPAEILVGEKLGIYYIGQPVVTINGTVYTLAEKASYGWDYISSITSNTDYFYIKPALGKILTIKSLYIADKFTDTDCYNTGYSVSLSNNAYFTVKTPCIYSNPASGITQCASKTCNYCIGNTYNYDQTQTITYGTPICYGAKSVSNADLSYLADTNRPKYLTIQSPISTTENPYTLKYRPFYMHSTASSELIPVNKCMIYDTKDNVTPVKYKVELYSAGGIGSNIRGDIFFIKDNSVILTGDNKRYLVLGGDYGLIDMVYDMMVFVERQIPLGVQLTGPAVYDTNS